MLLPFAIFFKHVNYTLDSVEWSALFIGALIWAIFILSIASVFLWFSLIRKSAATNVTSLLYLTPPTTAVMEWLMFGEVISMIGIIGMILAIAGAFFVLRK